MRSYRSVTAATLAIALSALAGGVFGHSALATEDRIPDHYKTFTAALSAIQANYVDEIESAIVIRDRKDSTRAHSPLAEADDAIVVDTTGMTIDEVVEHIMEMLT